MSILTQGTSNSHPKVMSAESRPSKKNCSLANMKNTRTEKSITNTLPGPR